ncbi:NAD(P)-dependent oxidoreductase [Actinomycetospora sp. TBRC 11914]|uniref:NAD(P)-dependent oxidoreductase n=1 Tax=Actinomycetospora sp. TBRC 11914 TaxID=2729387 RepID=UPI00145CA133|nr:NAD(P)-dependent oxidoreductase [Actinomycetospora sp. TBRC 11914]NMO89477.1 NAD(P)-dependent oxidoreductase [Actinomycetospora sp. TBRC 11914]
MRIAVIGLGGMGSALAERLLDEGHELEVWNRSTERSAPFAPRARVLGDPDAVGADVVVLSLADDASVTAVARPDGRPRAAWTDRLVVNTATVAPATEAELAEAYGDRFVAAPILGAPQAVRTGQARWMVGGPDDAREALTPLWAAFATTTVAGTAPERAAVLKLLSNQMLLAGLAVVAETVRLGRAAGVGDDALTDLLHGSPMLPPGLLNRVDGLVDPEHAGWFATPLGAKDLTHALGLAADGAPFPVTAGARDAYRRVADEGWADADVTAVVELGRRP